MQYANLLRANAFNQRAIISFQFPLYRRKKKEYFISAQWYNYDY